MQNTLAKKSPLEKSYKMENRKVVIDSQLINYFVNQDFDNLKTTLIFLHGWRSEAKVWLGIINSLNLNCNYIAIDLPGFGSSPTPSSAWSMNDYAKLVNNFIIKQNLKNVVLVGHSFGGRTSIKLAGEVFDKQKYNIEKIVLTGSAGFVDNSGQTNLKQKIARIVKPFFELPVISQTKPLVYKLIGADDYNAREDLKEIFVNVINEDLTEQMKRISLPTLLIFGRDDESTPVSFGERMNVLMPNSELKIIENAGHFAFLDQSKEWVSLVRGFLG
jgi:pimeloyl-ACP methyl ester carboxylesterase